MRSRNEWLASPKRARSLRAIGVGLLMIAAPGLAAATDGVRGELSVDGQAIALTHARASETTMGGDDPVTFVLLTEDAVPAGPQGDIAAVSGDCGAMIALHLQASGKVYQAIGLHPKADPTFPTDLPKESVKVSGLRIEGGRIAAVVESVGELLVDGNRWQFRVELDLPVTAD